MTDELKELRKLQKQRKQQAERAAKKRHEIAAMEPHKKWKTLVAGKMNTVIGGIRSITSMTDARTELHFTKDEVKHLAKVMRVEINAMVTAYMDEIERREKPRTETKKEKVDPFSW